jgi:NUDIX domain-containing protein
MIVCRRAREAVDAVSDVRYFWHEAPAPGRLEVTQVYGWLLCPRTSRVLVEDDDGTFNLPGGTPEAWDADLTATLVREAFEENQVRVGATAYLGYQEVHRPGRAPCHQVRAPGIVTNRAGRSASGRRQPDWMSCRLLVRVGRRPGRPGTDVAQAFLQGIDLASRAVHVPQRAG